MTRIRNFIVAAICAFSASANADCVVGASMTNSFRVLDSHTIILYSGSTPKILIKTFTFLYSTSSVSVLKDSFCDFESAVLFADGQVVDAQQVKRLN